MFKTWYLHFSCIFVILYQRQTNCSPVTPIHLEGRNWQLWNMIFHQLQLIYTLSLYLVDVLNFWMPCWDRAHFSVKIIYTCIPINSLGLSDAYMRQLTNHHWFILWLVAWTVPSHYLNQYWIIVNWTLANIFQWKFNQNTTIFIEENACENVVCEMPSILSRPQCVKKVRQSSDHHLFIIGIPTIKQYLYDETATVFIWKIH